MLQRADLDFLRTARLSCFSALHDPTTSRWIRREILTLGLLAAPVHDITMDSKGNIYPGEAATAGRVQKFAPEE